MDIIAYEDAHEKHWDDFVNNVSINGTFLQTRAFLNYHPKNRFSDCSLLICKQSNVNRICAVVPACETVEDNRTIFYSHAGSTFGGIVISKKCYNIIDIVDILNCLDKWIKERGYKKAVLKITSEIFSLEKTDLLEYVLWNRGYNQYSELSTFIDYATYSSDIITNFNNNRARNINKIMKKREQVLIDKFINSDDEIREFHSVLCENLQKFDAKPVHTVEELFRLRECLGDSIVRFYGIYDSYKMVAGSMLFYFNRTNAYHTQYLCAKQDIDEYSPMAYLCYKLIEFAQDSKSNVLSLGNTTEQQGRLLNMGLAKAKEAYGSKFSLNRTFYKEMESE